MDPETPASEQAQRILQDYIARHGALKGAAFPIDPTIKQTDPTGRTNDVIETPNPDPVYHYEFADGTTLEVNGAGQIKSSNETKPAAAPKPAAAQRATVNGVVVEKGADGVWRPIQTEGVPPATPNASKQPPSDPSKWVPIKGPDGTVLALQDPVTGDRVQVPAGTRAERPQIVQTQGGGLYSWDGSTLKEIRAGTVQAKEGDTRPNVAGGYEIRQVYRGGEWVTDPTFTPRPYSAETQGKPKEGDRRPSVVGGYTVEQVYRGGDWVVDPSVPAKRFTPQAPTTVTAGAEQQYIVQQDPDTGEVKQIPNPNYRPADVGARSAQLQQQAIKKRDDLQQQYQAGLITQDDRDRQWNEWWQSEIEPQRAELARTRSREDLADQIKADAERRTQEEAARSVGTAAVSRATALLPYRTGPSFGAEFSGALNTLSGGGGQVNFTPGAFQFDLPNLDQIYEQATARALAGISPYAAQKANAAAPQLGAGYDPIAALNQSAYAPGGGTRVTLPDGTRIESGGGASSPAPSSAQPEIRDMLPERGPTASFGSTPLTQYANMLGNYAGPVTV